MLVANISLIDAQSTEIYSIKALKIDKSIVEVSQSTLDTLQLNGLPFYIGQYFNLSDWDNDGLKDLVITVGQVETINTYASLFKQKKVNGTVKFVEDPSYLMNIQGRPLDWETSVGDVNGDSFLDILLGTENYHGSAGFQPSYYIGNNETTDKLFLNTGQGFTRLELDTTTYILNSAREYWPSSGTIMLDWDFDGKLEILVSDTGPYRRVREGQNPVRDKLFSSFEIDANNKITREFVFDWPLDDEFIETQVQFLSVINDTLYLAHRVRKGWDIDNSIFVDKNNVNGQSIIWHSDQEVLIIDMKKSFGKAGLIKRITLDRKDKGGDMNYQDGFHLADIDNDGKLEYITAYWYESKDKQVPFIKIYDDDGTDITDTWLGDNYMDTSKKHGGNGVNVVDLNNDGYIDIIPRDGWNYYQDSHSPNMGDFTDTTRGTFGIFLNDGTKFNQYNIDFSHLDIDEESATYLRSGSRLYSKEPVDFDNDGLYEFLIRFDRGDGNANMDIVTINYKNNIEDISDLSIKEDSIKVIKLPGADLKGGTISYSAKSSENNVTATVSNDTLTLTPALNWHGNAQITAYASGSSWKDSTTFKLTVTPVSDIAAVQDVTLDEDKSTEVILTSTFTGTTTFSAVSDTNAVTASVTSSTLTLTPSANWHGVANIKAYASDGSSKDSTAFKLTVTPIQDLPTAFEWVSSALDTINITQENLETEYIFDCTASTDVDGDTIDYLLYAKIGVNPPEEIYDTTSTSVPITYLEFLENVFEPFPMLPRVTVQFSLEATDGIDTVKITGDNRVLFINRYAYLSTVSEGIPIEFALHENYPNPFNPSTTISYEIMGDSNVNISIYNIMGQEVANLVNDFKVSGSYSVVWNGTNSGGVEMPSGVYIMKLNTKSHSITNKLSLLR